MQEFSQIVICGVDNFFHSSYDAFAACKCNLLFKASRNDGFVFELFGVVIFRMQYCFSPTKMIVLYFPSFLIDCSELPVG